MLIRWNWDVSGTGSSISLANEFRVNDKRGYKIEYLPR